jgi:uncharacterized protein YfaP (DUF2135 family)
MLALNKVTILLLAGFAALPLYAAGFDCAKARSVVEKLICGDPDLNRQDERLAQLYKKLSSHLAADSVALKALQDNQKVWIRTQRNPCTDVSCLKEVYQARTTALETWLASGKSKQDIVLESPLGGWRNSFDRQTDHTRYFGGMAPAAATEDEENQPNVIQGQVHGSTDQPYRLIVNGNAMPLLVEEERFFQPFTFSPGSNLVEIRSPDRAQTVRTQFYEAHNDLAHPKIRIILSWDTKAELDLHVITPDGAHCSWNNPVLENGGAIDVDLSRGGYGPKIFVTPTPLTGSYLVYVNYWSDWNDSEDDHAVTIAHLSVITHENTPDEKVRTVTTPMRHPGELVLADRFIFP